MVGCVSMDKVTVGRVGSGRCLLLHAPFHSHDCERLGGARPPGPGPGLLASSSSVVYVSSPRAARDTSSTVTGEGRFEGGLLGCFSFGWWCREYTMCNLDGL